MSDVDKSSFAAPKPEAIQQGPDAQAPEDASTQTRHSGHLGLERPVREFDKTTLQQAVDQDRIKIPESPAALTKSKRNRFIGIAAAGTALVGGALFAMTRGGGSETEAPERPAATAAPNAENPPAAGPGVIVTMPENSPVTTVQITPETTEAPAAGPGVIIPESPATTQAPAAGPGVIVPATEVGSQNNPEVNNQEYTPVVMDGTTAPEVVDQLIHNYECMTNAPARETQIECLNFIFGSESQGSLVDSYREIIDETIAYRATDPQYTQTREYSIIDSRYSDTEIVAVIESSTLHHTANGTVGADEAPVPQRLTFRRGQATTEEIAVEDSQRPTWLLEKVEILEEGETTIE